MNRHKAREKAFQLLFQLDMNDTDLQTAITEFLGNKEKDDFFITIVEGVTKNKNEIDQIISEHLEKWTIERLASVEKVILRVATYEIKYLSDIPKNVSINEAVELGNIYGDDKSGKFINGVLSKIIS